MILRHRAPTNGEAPKPQFELDDEADRAIADRLAAESPDLEQKPAERSNANLPAKQELKLPPGLLSFRERALNTSIRKQKEVILRKAMLVEQCYSKGQIALSFEITDDGLVWGKLVGILNGGGFVQAQELATITPE